MMDMVPRPTRKWGIAVLVMLCVSAILFITPWVASTVFFEPYDNWSNEGRFSRPEKQGNTTWLCTPSGPCVGCTPSEKQDPTFKCKPTGYHLPQRCVEDNEEARSAQKLESKEIANRGDDEGTEEGEGSGRRMRMMLNHDSSRKSLGEDGVQVYVLYKSCLPKEVREKLSVLGFEGVVLGLLAISAPFVYFRKRRITLSSPNIVQRVPKCLIGVVEGTCKFIRMRIRVELPHLALKVFSNAGPVLQFCAHLTASMVMEGKRSWRISPSFTSGSHLSLREAMNLVGLVAELDGVILGHGNDLIPEFLLKLTREWNRENTGLPS
ncbi:hypothetical protein R1flu_006224 [Riccia fluitans]|uniref:Uncharacterized protein n=1 Tax=Riccia fluitans TaxID=41844 RepID=A0ABD1YVF2_9MARC